MFSIEDLRFFGLIARSTSLAAAARALGVTASAVSQRLRELETRLKVRLVDRSSRHLRLTDEGKLFLERGEAVLADIGQIADELTARRRTVSGHLRVAASFGFGGRFVAPVVAQFRSKHPAVTVDLVLSDNPLRAGPDSWDVMVHVGSLKESRLIARTLAPNRRIACASPEYVRRRGAPATPADLRDHDCIALYENDEDVTLWRFLRSGSEPVSVRVNAVMSSNYGAAIHDWARAGMGVILRSEWDVADDLRSGHLIQVLASWQIPAADVVALVSERSGKTARARQFIALLGACLSPPPWRVAAAALMGPLPSPLLSNPLTES